MQNQERRNFHRIAFNSEISLKTSQETISGELIDISLKGVLIFRPKNWHPEINDATEFSMKLDPEKTIVMQTKVVHADNEQIGLECQSIDLDSISYMRRLVSLDLGDNSLLERDLQALIHTAP
jgi:c-di-GMP-binding flagellar brake protein YcgR